MRKTRLWAIGCILSLAGAQTNADTIQLTNGDRLSGTLQRIDQSDCIFSTAYQSEVRIPRELIQYLKTDQVVSISLISGEKINGRVDFQFDSDKLQVSSSRFGLIRIGVDEFQSISAQPEADNTLVRAEDEELAVLHAKGDDGAPATNSENTAKVGEEQAAEQEEEKIQQVFLRASGILLQPGQQQVEVSMNYVRDEQNLNANLITASGVLSSDTRIRSFLFPIIGRFGLLPDLEGFVTVPLQHQEQDITVIARRALLISQGKGQPVIPEFGDITRIDDSSSSFGIGDIQAGLKYALHRDDGTLPEIVAQLDFRAPTGQVRNPALTTATSSGSGQWAAGLGVNLIKSFDPVVLFGTLRYEYDIFNRTAGTRFGSWSKIDYSMGFGFSVNDVLTLIGQYQGGYLAERKIDELTVLEREIASLRSGFTYKIAKNQYIEPSVTFGLNQVTPDTIVRLSYNRSFK